MTIAQPVGAADTPVGEYQADLEVTSKTTVADGVVEVQFSHPTGEQLPSWEPGAHIEIDLPGGLIRQYSLMSDPEDLATWSIGVLREEAGRGGSKYIHDELSVGDRIRVHGPRNHFRLEEAPFYHFIGGGIGITPLLPMIRAVDKAGADWRLTYGGRSLQTMAFRDQLESYGDRVELRPLDTTGMPDLEVIVARCERERLIYCCGPEGLLSALEDTCDRLSSPAPHVERFAPKDLSGLTNTAFEIELTQSSKTLQVPADRSILEVVRDAGVSTVASCEEGTCGTCETAVVSGIPEHRDSVLTADEQAENDYMMICVSRACSKRLVLEL